MKRKACRTCRIFVEEDICPICKKTSFTTSFQGQVTILDAKHSKIAEMMDIHNDGEYAVKVR